MVIFKSAWKTRRDHHLLLFSRLPTRVSHSIIISDPTHDKMHLRMGKVFNLTKCNFSIVGIISCKKKNGIFSSPRKVSASNWSLSTSAAGVTSPASKLCLSMNAFNIDVRLVPLFKEPSLGPKKRNGGLRKHFFMKNIYTLLFIYVFIRAKYWYNSVST